MTTPLANPVNSDNVSKPQSVIFTFDYAGLVSIYVTAMYVHDSTYLPIHSLFSDLMVDNKLDIRNKTISGFYAKESNKYRIDFGKGMAEIDGKTFKIDSSEFIAGKLDFYLLPSLYEKLFALKFSVDMSKLILVLSTRVDLPVVQNYQRKVNLRYAAQSFGIFRPQAPLLYPQERYLLNGGVLDYSVSSFYTKGIPSYSYDFTAGGELLGGDIEGAWDGELVNRRSTTISKTVKWRYVVDSTSLLTSISLGNLNSSGLNPYDFRGIQISNAPVEYRKILGSYTINEKVTPDWETELYLNGERVGYSKADALGNVHFKIPLIYGGSYIQLKSFGPNGQMSERDRRLQIPFTLLPAGELNYSLSAGELTSSNEKMVEANMDYGFTDWLTDEVGVDYLQDPMFNEPLPYNSLTLRVGSPYIITLEAAPSFRYQASFNAIYPSQASLAVTYDRYVPNALYNPSRSSQQVTLAGYLPFYLGNNSLNFNLSGNGQTYESGNKSLSYSVGANANLSRFNLSANYSGSFLELGTGRPVQGKILSASLMYSMRASSGPLMLLNGTLLGATGSYDFETRFFNTVSFNAWDYVANYISLQFSVTRDFLNRFTTFNFQITCDLPFVQAATSSQVQQSQTSVSQSVSGSVAYDSQYGRFLFNGIHWVGQSAVSMRMFLENNQDGKFEKGDKIIKSSDIVFRQAVSSHVFNSGVIRAWNLLPYTQYSVDIPSGSAQNPLWVSERKSFSFMSIPNVYESIDIPFYAAGVIEGSARQIINRRSVAVPGLELIVIGRKKIYRKTISAFNDGSLYYVGVPPGDYRIYVDPSQVAALGDQSIPAYRDFTVKSKKSGDFIKGLTFILKPAPLSPVKLAEQKVEAMREMRYLIQLGAFSTRARADRFAATLHKKLKRQTHVRYNTKSRLYCVQLDTMRQAEDAYYLEQELIYHRGIRGAFVKVLPDSNVEYTFSVRLGYFRYIDEAKRFAYEVRDILHLKPRINFSSPMRSYQVLVGAFRSEQKARDLKRRAQQFHIFRNASVSVSGRYIVARYAILMKEFERYGEAESFARFLFNDRGIDALVDFDPVTLEFRVYTTPTPYRWTAESLLEELKSLNLFESPRIIRVE